MLRRVAVSLCRPVRPAFAVPTSCWAPLPVTLYARFASNSKSRGPHKRARRGPPPAYFRHNKKINMLSSAGDLLDHWTVNSDEYDHVCYSTLVKCISRLRTRDIAAAEKDPRYMRILETARGLIDADPKWMGTRGLANLANSLSKLRQSESQDSAGICGDAAL